MVPIITIRAFFHNDMHEGETMYPLSNCLPFFINIQKILQQGIW